MTSSFWVCFSAGDTVGGCAVRPLPPPLLRPTATWVAVSLGVASPVQEICAWWGSQEPRGTGRRDQGGVRPVRRTIAGSAGGAKGSGRVDARLRSAWDRAG